MDQQRQHKKVGTGQPDRSIRILINLLLGTRAVFFVIAIFAPFVILGVPNMSLSFGGDPMDPDDDRPTFFLGVVYDEDTSRGAMVVEAFEVLIYSVLAVFVITKVLAIVRSVQTGASFEPENGTHLRMVAFAVIIAQVTIYFIWVVALTLSVSGQADLNGVSISLSPLPWIGVLIAFALATVFGEGAAMKEDQDLTV